MSPFGIATPLSCRAYNLEPSEVEGSILAASNLKGIVLKTRHIAEAAVFLASDESAYISGHNLAVDGGFTVVNQTFSASSSSMVDFFFLFNSTCKLSQTLLIVLPMCHFLVTCNEIFSDFHFISINLVSHCHHPSTSIFGIEKKKKKKKKRTDERFFFKETCAYA